MSTSVPSVPSLHSVFPELESWVPSSATHRHGYQGRRAARMQISEGPRDAPPAGIKGGAGRAPDLRSRCLPGAGRALPRSLLPRVPACRLQLRQSPAAPGKDSKPSCYKSQGWGASCQDRNERGATAFLRLNPYFRGSSWSGCALSQWEHGKPAPTPHSPWLGRWHLPRRIVLRTGQFVPRRCSLRSQRTTFGLCKVSRDWQGLKSV